MKQLVVLLSMSVIILFSGLLMAQEQRLYLPFPAGTTYRCVQGANGSYSHQSVCTRYDLDFDTPNDSDERVVASVSGIAYVHLDNGLTSFGNHINIDIGNNLFVMVAHLKSFSVQNKEVVVRGQGIGMEGTTGFSQGDHIHFGLHRGDAKKDALQSESIKASFIWAMDVTKGDTEYQGYESEDFVGDLYVGHFYKSNNDYSPGSLLAKCSTGFRPSNGYRLDPSAVLVLGNSGWHPFKRYEALSAYLARTWRSEDEIQPLTQSQMAGKNSKKAWVLDVSDFIAPGVAVKYLDGYKGHESSAVFYFDNDRKWHALYNLEAMQELGLKDSDIIFPAKRVLDYYPMGETYNAQACRFLPVPNMPDGLGGGGSSSPLSPPQNLRISE